MIDSIEKNLVNSLLLQDAYTIPAYSHAYTIPALLVLYVRVRYHQASGPHCVQL